MKYHNNRNQMFSFFESPITNTQPFRNITIYDVYRAITSDYLEKPTQQLRLIKGKDENRKFKATNFSYVTFSGTFKHRNEKALIHHSGLIAIDFDHLENLACLKSKLLRDQYFETQLLFVSPNGNGLKWVIPIEVSEQYPHGEMFQAIFNYIKRMYSIEIDKACKDISRATFLCYDPEAFINPKYLVQ